MTKKLFILRAAYEQLCAKDKDHRRSLCKAGNG